METEGNKILLLVEDEAIIALANMQHLKKLAYTVVHVTSGESAIEAVDQNDPPIDLILMDIDLGKGIDGTEAAQKILATHDIPILFLSSHTEKEVVEKTEKITSYGYVVKNSGITVLNASIKMAFKLFNAHREINTKNMVIKAGNENLRVTIEKMEAANSSLLKTEKELHIQMDRYKHAQQIGHIGNWEYDIASNTIWGSEEAKRIYNLPPELNNLPLEKIEMMDYNREKMNKALMDLIREEKVYDLEFEIKPWGMENWKWLHSVAELKKDAKGIPQKVVGVVQDITRQKEDAAALIQLQQAVNGSSDIILMLDKEGIITYINPKFTEVYGYKQDEVLHKLSPGILKYAAVDDEVEIQFWKDLHKTKQIITEFKNKSKEGKLVYVEVVIDALFDNHGDLSGFLEIQRDITDWKKTEMKLRKSEESLSITLQSIGDGVLATDLSGNITRINRVAEELTGWTDNSAIGKSLTDVFTIINAETRMKVENPVEKVLSTGSIVGLANHTVLISREGREYQIADSAAPIKDTYGNVRGVILVFYNVTEKYNREKENKRIQTLFEAMFNTIPDAVVITDTDRTIQLANTGLENTFGYNPTDIIGQKTLLLYAEKKNFKDTGSSVFNKDVKNNDKRYITYYSDKSGRTFPGETIGSKLYDNKGKWIGNLGIMRDISSQEKMISDLSAAREAAEKSEREKGLLLQEVHHRIKNHMSIVQGLLALQADSSQNRDTIDALKKAEDRVYAMTVLYDKLYRSDNFESIPVSSYLSTLTREIISTVATPDLHINSQIKIDPIDLDAKRLSILGIIVNELITNSIKYAFRDRMEGTIALEAYLENNSVYLCVSDDGVGIPESIISGVSSGFGIKLVSAMAEQLKAKLRFESNKGTKTLLEFEY